MDSPSRSRNALVIGGGAAALVAGLAIAWTLRGHTGQTAPPPPASKGGLVIDSNAQPDTKIAATRPLRCFVAGQLVGEFTLAECARRNGVATDALDVGVDPTGALAAAPQAGTVLAPLPPREAVNAEPKVETAGAGPVGACWRYEGGWRKLNGDMTLAACTQTLFAGRCEKPGQALYGRWAQQTVRLVPGKIEISSDNHSFRALADQAGACG
jgi:hypothetical protein